MHEEELEVVRAFIEWVYEFGHIVNAADDEEFICDPEQLVYDYQDELNSSE